MQYVGNNAFMVVNYIGNVTPISTNIFTRNGIIWTPPDYSAVYTWNDGKDYCTNSVFGGVGGWRLPTTSELVSLDAYGVKGTRGWPSTPANIWASDPSPSTPGAYAVVAYGFAVSGYQFGTNTLVVACTHD